MINQKVTGLALCKVVGNDLILCETVHFTRGRSAVERALRIASISGHVGGDIDDRTSFWADQIDKNGDSIGEVRLDRQSWNALKNRILKCKILKGE